MAQPLNPQPDCIDLELLPAAPLTPNAGSIRVYADAGTGDLVAIKADGSSALPSATPGGADTQIQFNDAGAFGGDANLTWDKVNGSLTVTGQGTNDTEISLQTDNTGTNGIFLRTSNGTLLILSQGQMEVSSQGEIDFISSANINFSAGTFVSFASNAATAKYQFLAIPVFANNAAAIAGGLTAGMLYRTGANPDPVCVVH